MTTLTISPEEQARYPTYFDLTNDSHYEFVRQLADALLIDEYREKELWDIVTTEDSFLFLRLASFLALSKLYLSPDTNKKFSLAIVINLVHEHNRLRPKSPDNPNGENAVRNKISQLDWLLNDTHITYKIFYISGTCPYGSDQVLEKIIQEEALDKKVKLIKVQDYEIGRQFVRNQKGGEVIFGSRMIADVKGYPNVGEFDAMLFTDADMTFDMGQLGLALSKCFSGSHFVTGNRPDARSVFVKNHSRSGPGEVVYRHITRRLGLYYYEKLQLPDTQAPWKLISKKCLQDIASIVDHMDWSWETDFFAAAKLKGYEIEIVPVSAVDSEKESHGFALGPEIRLLTIIYGLVRQHYKYGIETDTEMIEFVRHNILSAYDLGLVLRNNPPEKLKNTPRNMLGARNIISIQELVNWLNECRNWPDKFVYLN